MSIFDNVLEMLDISVEMLENNDRFNSQMRSDEAAITVQHKSSTKYFNTVAQSLTEDFSYVREFKVANNDKVYFLFSKNLEKGSKEIKKGVVPGRTAWFKNEKTVRFKLKEVKSGKDFILFEINLKEAIVIELKKVI